MDAYEDKRLVLRFWDLANAQDWACFARLLDADLVYTVPQTRERIRGAAGFVDFFRTWPQPWQATVVDMIAEPGRVYCAIAFNDANGEQRGFGIFETRLGQITAITDWWPESYEPPARHCAFIERY